MSGKHLGNSRSSFVIWSLINTWDFCPNWLKSAMTISEPAEFLPWESDWNIVNIPALICLCIAWKPFLVRLGLHWDLTCPSWWDCWVLWEGSCLGGSSSSSPGYPLTPINSELWYLLQYFLDCFFHVKFSKTNRLKYTIAYGAVIFNF